MAIYYFMYVVGGFGSVLLNNMRQISSLCQDQPSNTSNIPLILGRDFAGTVVAKGNSATKFEIGDEVYGVVKPHDQGCHSQYAVTLESLVSDVVINVFFFGMYLFNLHLHFIGC